MNFTACLLLGLSADASVAGAGAAITEQIAYRRGSYVLAGQRIKFFGFTYQGELSTEAVQRANAEVINNIIEQDVSAVQKIVPSSGHPPQRALNLAKGQVLVLGWVNGSRHDSGWLAADTDGQPHSKHRWLASTGESDTLDSGKAWLDPERSTRRQCWKLNGSRSHYLILQVQATMGRLDWFLDWQER